LQDGVGTEVLVLIDQRLDRRLDAGTVNASFGLGAGSTALLGRRI